MNAPRHLPYRPRTPPEALREALPPAAFPHRASKRATASTGATRGAGSMGGRGIRVGSRTSWRENLASSMRVFVVCGNAACVNVAEGHAVAKPWPAKARCYREDIFAKSR